MLNMNGDLSGIIRLS